jgi:hypothetical protein
MELEQAISLLKTIVKNNGTNDSRHLDIGLVPNEERPTYEEALMVAKLAVLKGKITQDELFARIHLSA